MVQRGSDDAAVGACPKDLGRVHVNFMVAELALKIDANVSLLAPFPDPTPKIHYNCIRISNYMFRNLNLLLTIIL